MFSELDVLVRDLLSSEDQSPAFLCVRIGCTVLVSGGDEVLIRIARRSETPCNSKQQRHCGYVEFYRGLLKLFQTQHVHPERTASYFRARAESEQHPTQ